MNLDDIKDPSLRRTTERMMASNTVPAKRTIVTLATGQATGRSKTEQSAVTPTDQNRAGGNPADQNEQ